MAVNNLMRSISVLKILQIFMGLIGIFIIILGVGYMEALKGGLIELVLRNPIFGGLATGLPLIPLIHSAKQKYTMTYHHQISNRSSTATLANDSYEVPVAGWLTSFKTTVFQQTAYDQDFAMALTWHHDSAAIVWDQGTDNENVLENIVEQWDTDSVHEFQTPFPVHLFYIDAAVDNSDQGVLVQETKVGGPGHIYEQGELLFCSLAHADFGTNATQGTLNIVSQATFIVIAYDRKKRQTSETAPWVTIVGESPGTGDSMFAWPANSNMRIVNLRLTVYAGLDVDNQASFTIDKNAPDLTLSTDSIEMHMKPFMQIVYPIQDATGGGHVHQPIVTNYSRGPYYMKKGEALQFRHQSMATYFSVQFQYIPDYNYTAEFRRRADWATYSSGTGQDYTNQWIAMFTVPYDMYVTTVKGWIGLITDNNESDAVWNLDLMGLKNKNMIDNTDMMLNYANANMDGNILGAANGAGQLPWTLATIPVVIDSVDTNTVTETVDNTTTAARVTYAEAVADFYPRGSQIGFWFPSNASLNISSMVWEMHIEALNRIKTNNAGSNVFDGYTVARHEVPL